MRRVVGMAASAVLAVPLVTLTATPAQALTCDGAHVGVYATVRTVGPVYTPTDGGGTTIKLELKNERVSDWSHALITQGYVSGASMRVWVERSSNNSTWSACSKTTGYRSLEANNIKYYMRACMDYLYNSTRFGFCTSSYYDND
ncbi:MULTISPECIES: hypothetical protein [Streptomyces]|uniref:hypothetical protein n=1 Tax=Streptomyces TaxID=1883 RepID=UPI00131C43C0|nr:MULTISPECIES: hypothetical protein [Streptomyces]